MSAFQPVGDTVALTLLAYQLYRKGYQVAKSAPDEFRALLGELNVFKQTVWQVQKATKDSGETLGEDIIAICTNVLVLDFQPLVLKYEKLGKLFCHGSVVAVLLEFKSNSLSDSFCRAQSTLDTTFSVRG